MGAKVALHRAANTLIFCVWLPFEGIAFEGFAFGCPVDQAARLKIAVGEGEL